MQWAHLLPRRHRRGNPPGASVRRGARKHRLPITRSLGRDAESILIVLELGHGCHGGRRVRSSPANCRGVLSRWETAHGRCPRWRFLCVGSRGPCPQWRIPGVGPGGEPRMIGRVDRAELHGKESASGGETETQRMRTWTLPEEDDLLDSWRFLHSTQAETRGISHWANFLFASLDQWVQRLERSHLRRNTSARGWETAAARWEANAERTFRRPAPLALYIADDHVDIQQAMEAILRGRASHRVPLADALQASQQLGTGSRARIRLHTSDGQTRFLWKSTIGLQNPRSSQCAEDSVSSDHTWWTAGWRNKGTMRSAALRPSTRPSSLAQLAACGCSALVELHLPISLEINTDSSGARGICSRLGCSKVEPDGHRIV